MASNIVVGGGGRRRGGANTVYSVYTFTLLMFVSQVRESDGQACGGTFTALEGVITSPLYPKYYTNDLDCIYVIRAPTGYRVTLSFHDFSLEASDSCEYDFVQIHDGEFLTSSVIDNLFCEVTLPYDVRTIGNKMLIQFKTDDSVTDRGFNASYITKIIPQEFMLVTTSGGNIYRVEVHTASVVEVPVVGLYKPSGIHYDPVDDRMYWTDITLIEIRSAFLNGSDNRRVRHVGPGNTTGTLEGITLDTQSRLIFYTDAGNQVIGLITIPTYQHEYLITDNVDAPRAIVLDSLNGIIFWTDWGPRPRIERANYDGSDRKVIVSIAILYPNGLALDAASNRLYWADSGTHTVEWTHTEGLNRATIISSSNNAMFFSLALNNDQLYLTDWTSAGSVTNESYVYRMNIDGTNATDFLYAYYNRVNGIYVYSAISTGTGPNGCSVGQGGCSHICIPSSGNNTKCLCPSGQYLSDDQKTCISEGPNVCSNGQGGCSHICIPSSGNNTKCLCPSGQYLSDDQKTCLSEGTETSLNYPLIGGAAGGGLVLILLIIVIIVCVKRRRDKSSNDRPRPRPQDSRETEGSYDTISKEFQNGGNNRNSNIYSEIGHTHEVTPESINMANMAALVNGGYLHPTYNLQPSSIHYDDSVSDYDHPV